MSAVDSGVKQYSKPVPGFPLSSSSGIPNEVPGSFPSPYWAKYTDWPLGAVSNISKSPIKECSMTTHIWISWETSVNSKPSA